GLLDGQGDRCAPIGVGETDLERLFDVGAGSCRPRPPRRSASSRGSGAPRLATRGSRAPARLAEERLEEIRERRGIAEEVLEILAADRPVFVLRAARSAAARIRAPIERL